MALVAFEEDADVRRLIRRLEVRNPGKARDLVHDLILRNMSTLALTAEYGSERPSALEFFKGELRLLVGDAESGPAAVVRGR